MARVSKLMIQDVPILKKEASIEDAARLMVKDQHGCVVIVEDEKPIGIVTEIDIAKKVISRGMSLKEPVAKIMSYPITFMTPSLKLDEAIKIIDTKKFRVYPVVEYDRLVGLAAKKDVVHAVSDNIKLHRNIQNIILVLFVLFEFFIFIVHEYFYKSFGA